MSDKYGPPDAFDAPRYTGIRTFARLPHIRELAGVDVALVGVPFDTATSFRPGARFGPEGIRSGSTLLRPYNPGLKVDVFQEQSVVDFGDIAVTPGNAEKTTAQIAGALSELLAADVIPIILGGDHSIVLGELRAQADRHGPVAVVLLDAHADTWDQYYGEKYFHGTPFRRALEEGLIDPHSSVLAGMRGSLYSARDLEEPREMGFDVITCEELRSLQPGEYGQRVRDRVGDRPAFLSFDIDVIDPAFAPGTGTPEVSGLFPHEAQGYVRSLAGLRFGGFDLVEVSPPYDSRAQATSMLAANVVLDFLALSAVIAN